MNFIPGQKGPKRLWYSRVTFKTPMFLLLKLFRKLKMTCKSSIPLVLIFTFHLLHIVLSFSKCISADVQCKSPGIQEKPGCVWMNKYRHCCQHQDILVLSWGRDVQAEGVESIKTVFGIHYFYTEMLLNNILRVDRRAVTQDKFNPSTYTEN